MANFLKVHFFKLFGKKCWEVRFTTQRSNLKKFHHFHFIVFLCIRTWHFAVQLILICSSFIFGLHFYRALDLVMWSLSASSPLSLITNTCHIKSHTSFTGSCLTQSISILFPSPSLNKAIIQSDTTGVQSPHLLNTLVLNSGLTINSDINSDGIWDKLKKREENIHVNYFQETSIPKVKNVRTSCAADLGVLHILNQISEKT